MLPFARKEELRVVAEEIGKTATLEMKVADLREIILGSKAYKNDPEPVNNFLSSIVEARKRKEEQSDKLELENKLEFEKIKLEKAKPEAQLALEKAKMDKEVELERISLENAKIESVRIDPDVSSASANGNSFNCVENYIQSVRTLTLPIPKIAEGWNLFFASLERAFNTKNAPDEFKGEILLNLMGEKATNILIYIKAGDVKDCKRIKDTVLREFEPTPLACLQNFQKAKRLQNETHVQFASRLATVWEQYCTLRDVKDLETLKELIVSDKLYQSLDQETSTHVNLKQERGWLRPLMLGKECDLFFTSTNRSFSEVHSDSHKYSSNEHKSREETMHYIPPHSRRDGPKFKSKDKETKKLECYICGQNHMARNCNKKYSETDTKIKEAVVAKVNSDFLKPDVNIHPLTRVTVSVEGKEIDCILDSGTQVFVINSALLNNSESFDYGKIVLTSAFRENVEAKLIKSTTTLPNKMSLNHPLECIIAVTDKLNVDALIPLSLYESLCSLNKEKVMHFVPDKSECLENRSHEEKNENDSALSETMNDSDDSNFHSDATKLKQEQKECLSLETVRDQLTQSKGNFVLIEGLIYHKDKILNEPVAQLALPRSRVENVMKLAHESVFGGHMGVRKTKERIRYNFYWPNMSNDVADFVRTCMGCQLRRKDKISDRAPITPVARPELPFEIVNIDLIGPIEPPSGRGHKIPSVIASDRGTNFTSALTKEFVKRIGSSPRFSCPGYLASNGLVERWNGVLKNMLHQIIREDPRNWDHQIPFLLFAYREVPNTTTGVSLFRLMYGREARGPLAILKSSWAGEVHLPPNVTLSAVDYLQEIKIKMEKAAEKASLVAADKQKSYSEYFNKRSSVRAFNIGEQVVLLIPDSSNKLYARWTGPGEIVEHHPPHSYKVRLADGTVRHVYVNKIRKYYPRSLAVGVIFEEDHDFGEINSTPNTSDVDSRELYEKIYLNHLSDEQRNELCGLLFRHNELFTCKMKVAKVGAHRIRFKPGAERKKPFVYRIPEALKDKVDEQIELDLDLDLDLTLDLDLD
ncbi:hypothetical protein AVEN_22818-1 [Araneus ventricosus]|uniref:RNA-directed DNA polymerase n=1 Tax=Araneus ventricosus TaxID=182803 RepID=A0A4Y2SCR1_ARAVE|nr:hypothetical protein AVEN_22818-1 [Araneus ventricosus]